MDRTVSICGCGSIGEAIARAIRDKTVGATVVSLCDRNREKREALVSILPPNELSIYKDASSITDFGDIVIEAGGHEMAHVIVEPALDHGSDVILMSTGVLADSEFFDSVLETLDQSDGELLIPSGAIAGLDAVKSMCATGDVELVELETRKPLAGLEGSAFFENQNIDLTLMTEPTVVFEGTASEAATNFPSNVNVAMTLSLAGIGKNETSVTIIADPEIQRNTHSIRVSGEAGTLDTTVANEPSPNNPKTSYLASLAAIATLQSMTEPLTITP
jgi:aspartate dehydrogenase